MHGMELASNILELAKDTLEELHALAGDGHEYVLETHRVCNIIHQQVLRAVAGGAVALCGAQQLAALLAKTRSVLREYAAAVREPPHNKRGADTFHALARPLRTRYYRFKLFKLNTMLKNACVTLNIDMDIDTHTSVAETCNTVRESLERVRRTSLSVRASPASARASPSVAYTESAIDSLVVIEQQHSDLQHTAHAIDTELAMYIDMYDSSFVDSTVCGDDHIRCGDDHIRCASSKHTQTDFSDDTDDFHDRTLSAAREMYAQKLAELAYLRDAAAKQRVAELAHFSSNAHTFLS